MTFKDIIKSVKDPTQKHWCYKFDAKSVCGIISNGWTDFDAVFSSDRELWWCLFTFW